jgi:hypothetical protein
MDGTGHTCEVSLDDLEIKRGRTVGRTDRWMNGWMDGKCFYNMPSFGGIKQHEIGKEI